MTAILVTEGIEMRRIMFQGQHRPKHKGKTLSQIQSQKEGLEMETWMKFLSNCFSNTRS
jgi:hypothetical protein